MYETISSHEAVAKHDAGTKELLYRLWPAALFMGAAILAFKLPDFVSFPPLISVAVLIGLLVFTVNKGISE